MILKGEGIKDPELKEEMYDLLEAEQGNGPREESSEAKEFDPKDMDPETMQGAER